MMSVYDSEYLTGARTSVDSFGSEMSSGGTGEESEEAGADKGTDSGRGTDADVVLGAGGEKYGTDSKT